MTVKVSKQFLPLQKVFARGNRSEKNIIRSVSSSSFFFPPSLLPPPSPSPFSRSSTHHLLFLPSSSPPFLFLPRFLRVSLSGSSPPPPLSFYFFYSFYFFGLSFSPYLYRLLLPSSSFIFPSSCLSGGDANQRGLETPFWFVQNPFG